MDTRANLLLLSVTHNCSRFSMSLSMPDQLFAIVYKRGNLLPRKYLKYFLRRAGLSTDYWKELGVESIPRRVSCVFLCKILAYRSTRFWLKMSIFAQTLRRFLVWSNFNYFTAIGYIKLDIINL